MIALRPGPGYSSLQLSKRDGAGAIMPSIQITMLKGRTIEQKRKLVERMTEVIAEEAKTPKEGVVVTILEVEREDYARGGVLMADRK